MSTPPAETGSHQKASLEMCGILAILETPTSRLRARVHARRASGLLERLTHRGPDGRGTLQLEHAWLGHRRLAIIDPQGGKQPLRHAGVASVVNGEIFNHEALRERYALHGLPHVDSAVIAPLWALRGTSMCREIDGEFAFVCVDERTGAWIAARDHMGICPLYVGWHRDGTMWFASEMKALVDDCERVEIVPPGGAWLCDGHGVRRVQWYQPAWATKHEDGDAALFEAFDPAQVRDLLIESVNERLMSDVPMGLLLSGGLDSSLIAAIASRHGDHGGRFHSFSIGLAGAPDLSPAREVAGFVGTIHHEFHFTIEEALDAVPLVVRHLESWEQVRTAVPTYLLAKRIRSMGFKSVLSGEGADELFGGYLYFHKAPSALEMHAELVRKVTRLHLYDVMRANKATMAAGLEVRVPFLDRGFVDHVMSIDPRQKMIDLRLRDEQGHAIMEKYILRKAFDNPRDPWIPDSVLWRQKEQFSDGVGYAWVDTLRDVALKKHGDIFASRHERWGEDAPTTPELCWMRSIFEEQFAGSRAAGPSACATVARGRSVACSTPEALAWDPSWQGGAGDISGRMIAGVHGVTDSAPSGTPEPSVRRAGSEDYAAA
ncbi:MAG: asparagine synthase B [Phycisphaerales bacterium]|nr:asparagine synthase B [Phycisphaerales bacterium]